MVVVTRKARSCGFFVVCLTGIPVRGAITGGGELTPSLPTVALSLAIGAKCFYNRGQCFNPFHLTHHEHPPI